MICITNRKTGFCEFLEQTLSSISFHFFDQSSFYYLLIYLLVHFTIYYFTMYTLRKGGGVNCPRVDLGFKQRYTAL